MDEISRQDPTTEILYIYLRFGGLPYLSAIGLSETVAFEYLENVRASILLAGSMTTR
jgi:uncharacterized protein YuzE